MALAKDLTQTTVGIYDKSAQVSMETLTSIHNDEAAVLGDETKVNSLQSAIKALTKQISKDKAIIDAFSWALSWVFPGAQSIVKEVGSLIANQGRLIKQVKDDMEALNATKRNLAQLQGNLAWVTAVHEAASEVNASSLQVATTMQTITATINAALENGATSGVFAMPTLKTVAQDFVDIEAAINVHEAAPLPVAHALLTSGPRMAMSMSAAVAVRAFAAPVVAVSLHAGGNDVLADMAGLVGFLCGQLWIGDGASLMVARQPRLTLSLLPTLGETQALAASHAGDWANDVRGGMINVMVGITDMSTASEAIISQMLALVDTATDDTDLETNLMQGVTILSSSLNNFADTLSDNVIPVTTAKRQNITDDTVRFGSLSTQMVQKYTGPKAEIAQLSATVHATSTQIAAMNKAITTRATNQLVELYKTELIFVVGMALASVTVPLGPLIGGVVSATTVQTASKMAGRVMNAAGSKISTSASKAALEVVNGSDGDDVVKTIEEYGAQLRQLTDEKLQAAAFLVLKQNINELGSSVSETHRVLKKLQTNIAAVNGELKVMAALIPDKGSASNVKDKLAAMKAGHSQIQQHARAATQSVIFSS